MICARLRYHDGTDVRIYNFDLVAYPQVPADAPRTPVPNSYFFGTTLTRKSPVDASRRPTT